MKIKRNDNNTNEVSRWDQDDLHDKLAAQLAEANAISADDIPSLPKMKAAPKQAIQQAGPLTPRTKDNTTINVKQLMETLLEAWTNPTVHMFTQGSELCFDQIDQETMTRNSWRVGFSHVKTESTKLIK